MQDASWKTISQIRAAGFVCFSGSQFLLSNGLQPFARRLITRLHRVRRRSDGSEPLAAAPTHWSGPGGSLARAAAPQELELGLISCPAVEPSRGATQRPGTAEEGRRKSDTSLAGGICVLHRDSSHILYSDRCEAERTA